MCSTFRQTFVLLKPVVITMKHFQTKGDFHPPISMISDILSMMRSGLMYL